ncbi:MAG: glycosyltransferase family 1 protein [Candidatus Binatia bacterium]|nr:glycosyltransferase family 1 protein [Candidatus Binatia bacterium]
MRIGIDARWIRHEASGIGTYTLQLIEHLVRITQAEHTFVLLFDDGDLRARVLRDARLETSGVETLLVPYGPMSPLSQLRLPRVLVRQRIDVFHSTNFMIPLISTKIPCVATIHDMIPMLFPEANSKKARLSPLYDAIMRRVGKRAARILTVSEVSRRDVVRCLGLSAEAARRTRTIHCGVGAEFRPGPARARPKDRTRTILFVGRSDPHKNLVGLVEGFAQTRARLPFDAKLVIVGPEDGRFPEPATRATELGVAEAVEWRGLLDQDALVEAYRNADVLCLPSRYEGFGLPVVEAMAVGTPVVCSNGGSLPEVAGDAALQFAPDDIAALSAALGEVLTNEAGNAPRIAHGRARAAGFTWTRAAEQTIQVYEDLSGEAASTSS